MKVGVSRGFTVNLGHFESYRPDVYIEISSEEIGVQDQPLGDQVDALYEVVTGLVNALVYPELQAGAEMSAEPKSFVHVFTSENDMDVPSVQEVLAPYLGGTTSSIRSTVTPPATSAPKRIVRQPAK